MKIRPFIKNQISYLMLPSYAKRIIDEIRSRNLTYLSRDRLVSLARLVLWGEKNSIPGDIIETGCALGGSAILMSFLKSRLRMIKTFDVFGMIPEPSSMDGTDVQKRYREIALGKSSGIAGDEYYGYIPDLKIKVIESFHSFDLQLSENNIELIEGLLEDTLKITSSVSLAHIDVDWYESVMISLLNIEPKLSAGGSIVIDDYYDWSGCRRAVDEYFFDKLKSYTINDSSGSLILTKLFSK